MVNNKRKTDEVCKSKLIWLRIKKNANHFLTLAIILLGAAIICSAIPIGYNAINNEKNATFANPWKYSINDEAYEEVSLPTAKEVPTKSNITLKNQLPEQVIKGATVLLRTSQQDVEVYVDEDNIYSSYDMKTNIRKPTSAYHFVRLPMDCESKDISIVLSSPYANYAGLMNQIYIGSKASNIFFLVEENGFKFIIGFLIFSLGFILSIAFLCARKQSNKLPIACLGAFFICAGYWVMVESKMMQFIFPYPVALTNSSIFALTLLPVFSSLYYYNIHTMFLKEVGRYVIGATIIGNFLFSIIAFINPAMPLLILPYYLVLIAIYLVVVLICIIAESMKMNKLFNTAVYGIIAFGVFALLELLFYLSNMKNYKESNLLTIGLLLLCIAMAISSVQKFTKVYQTAIEVNTLSVLAYVDSLTGLKNRTAFLESVYNTNIDKEQLVTVAMFDINDLKLVNDTLGHLAGDALLIHSAKTIRNSLRKEDELYRIGGDEFVAVIHHDNAQDVDSFEKRIIESIEKENKKVLSYSLSIAYGYATFSKDIDKAIFETLARADKEMYACKKIQKMGRVQNEV